MCFILHHTKHRNITCYCAYLHCGEVKQCRPQSNVIMVRDLLPREIRLDGFRRHIGHRVQHDFMTTSSDDTLIDYTQSTNHAAADEISTALNKL